MRRSLRLRWGLSVVAALLVLVPVVSGCGSPVIGATQDETGGGTIRLEVATEAASDESSVSTEAGAAKSRNAEAGFFDTSAVHEIAVTFSQDDYDAAMTTYAESGDKEWIKATVTIDGEIYENVGVRLKGNSSIMGLQDGKGFMGGRGPMFQDEPLEAADADENDIGEPDVAEPDTAEPDNAEPDTGEAPVRTANGTGGDISTGEPEGLPWLIDLDKFVDRQNHEGIVELAVRSNGTETALNEAVSLELLREAGLASQEAAYVRFSVNGSEPRLRLVVENPDDMWMAKNFTIKGALYKAESSGDYSYRGEDPETYDEVFDQEAGKTNADLTPLIEFLDFINNSDDTAFNAQLPERLDIDAFATYLAMQELMANSDDIDGMGNNSYLYYDTEAEQFTVVAWDHNLAFGVMGGAGGFAGGDRGGATGPNTQGLAGEVPDSMQLPERGRLPEGTERPEDTQLPEGMEPPSDVRFPGGGQTQGNAPAGMRGRSNILVERFMANPEWKQLYEDRLAELTTELYEGGKAADILTGLVTFLKTQAADLVAPSAVEEEASAISRLFATD